MKSPRGQASPGRLCSKGNRKSQQKHRKSGKGRENRPCKLVSYFCSCTLSRDTIWMEVRGMASPRSLQLRGERAAVCRREAVQRQKTPQERHAHAHDERVAVRDGPMVGGGTLHPAVRFVASVRDQPHLGLAIGAQELEVACTCTHNQSADRGKRSKGTGKHYTKEKRGGGRRNHKQLEKSGKRGHPLPHRT